MRIPVIHAHMLKDKICEVSKPCVKLTQKKEPNLALLSPYPKQENDTFPWELR
jgi:hypothetical protein